MFNRGRNKITATSNNDIGDAFPDSSIRKKPGEESEFKMPEIIENSYPPIWKTPRDVEVSARTSGISVVAAASTLGATAASIIAVIALSHVAAIVLGVVGAIFFPINMVGAIYWAGRTIDGIIGKTYCESIGIACVRATSRFVGACKKGASSLRKMVGNNRAVSPYGGVNSEEPVNLKSLINESQAQPKGKYDAAISIA
jgi:hypothetical protein